MRKLDLEEIHFVSASFCSRDGRIFEWQDQLYRAITPERSLFYERLFRDGVVDHLVDRAFLVHSELTQIALEGFGLVVQHQRVPFISYPFEWSDQALKDSALFFLRLNLELLEFGLMTHDVHPWNTLFEGPRPIFVDIDSIRPLEDVDFAKWLEKFHRFYLRPLHLFSSGQGRLARLCLQDRSWQGGVSHEDYVRLMELGLFRRLVSKQVRRIVPTHSQAPLRPLRRFLSKLLSSRRIVAPPHDDVQSRRTTLHLLTEAVEPIGFPGIMYWNYYEDLFTFPPFTDSQDWSSKQRAIADTLKMTKPMSVIDIGSNRGWYAQLAAQRGANVVAIDKSEPLVSALYCDAKDRNLTLQPLVMDLLWPSPGFGLLDFWAPAIDRLKCEMVLALALVHHLVHREGLCFHHIVEGWSKFTTRWLLTEFVPYEDPHLSTWDVKKLDWYSLGNFLASLEREYNVIQVMESDPAARVLVLCERRTRSTQR